MLPHIHPKNRNRIRNRVLVLRADNLQLALCLVTNQPSPATALQAHQNSIKSSFKFLHAAPLALDGLFEGRRHVNIGLVRAIGRQVLPEQGVVDVAAAVELDG